jgi:hypothetical protein
MGDFEKAEAEYIKSLAPKVLQINQIGGQWQGVVCENLTDLGAQAKCRRIKDLSTQYDRDYNDLRTLTKTCEYNFAYSLMDQAATKEFEQCMETVKSSLSNFVDTYHTFFTEA